jgi:hypothetical protein
MDVVEGWVLPYLAAWDAALAAKSLEAAAAAAEASAAGTASTEASAAIESAGTASAAGSIPRMSALVEGVYLSAQHQKQLMQLLAFPMAAGLLTAADLEQALEQQAEQQAVRHGEGPAHGARTASSSTPEGTSLGKAPLQRSLFSPVTPKIQQPRGGSSSLIERIRRVAVAVTTAGQPIRLHLLTSQQLAAAATTHLAQQGQAAEVYLPKALGNAYDLPDLFPTYPWAMVSSKYATSCSKGLQGGDSKGTGGTIAGVTVKHWGLLFRALGVLQWLPVKPQQHSLGWKELMLEHKDWMGALGQLDQDRR